MSVSSQPSERTNAGRGGAQVSAFARKAAARKGAEAGDKSPTRVREVEGWSGRPSPAAYLESGFAPLRAQRRPGRAAAPRGVARASSLRVGKGDASLPLLVSPDVTLPLSEDGGLGRQDSSNSGPGFPPRLPGRLELRMIPTFQLSVLLALSQIERRLHRQVL